MKSSSLRNTGLFALCFFLFSACQPNKNKGVGAENGDSVTSLQLPDAKEPRPEWSRENKVVVLSISDPDNLHPSNGNSQTRAEINLYIHEALVMSDLKNGGMMPALCKSMPVVSPDQLRLTFELREEPRWDDGTPLTAQDVIFTCKAAKCPLTENPAAKAYFSEIKEVVADPTNPLKFTVVMKRAFIQNVGIWSDQPIIERARFDSTNTLSTYTFAQLDDSTYKAGADPKMVKWAASFNDQANGSVPNRINGLGPYQVVEWTPGQQLVLQKKPNHWTKNSTNYWETSYPEQIIYKINHDAAAQKLEFKAQHYDGTGYLGTRALLELRADSAFNLNYNSKFMDTYGYTYLAMNMKPDGQVHKPILTDVQVRRALAYATCVDDIIRVVNKGVNKRVAGPVSFLKKSCNTSLKIIPFDPAQAEKILEKAGWLDTDGDGIRDKVIDGKKIPLQLELAYLSVQVEWKEMALQIQEGMAKAGIKIIPVAYDYPVWQQKASSHDFDIIMGTWNSSSMPEDYSQLWSTASWIGGGPNYVGFGDAKSDAMIDSVAHTFDETKRNEIEKRIQQRIYDDQPYVFMYGIVRRCVVHKRFHNGLFYAERPGVTYNNLILPGAGVTASPSAQ